MQKTTLLCLAALAGLTVSPPTSAAMLRTDFKINASIFSSFDPAAVAPVDPLTVDLSIVFDTDTTVQNAQNGLTVTTFNVPGLLPADVVYSTAASLGAVSITVGSPTSAQSGDNFFFLSTSFNVSNLIDAGGGFVGPSLFYVTADGLFDRFQHAPGAVFFVAVSVIVDPEPPEAVPAPGALGLFGMGLLGLSAARPFRRRMS